MTVFKCAELDKVRQTLDEKGIIWKNKSDILTERIHFMIGGIVISVVNSPYSYGGEAGLLETMPPTTQMPTGDEYSLFDWARDVEGWLTADEVINVWINENL